MKRLYFLWALLIISSFSVYAQEQIAVIQSPYVLLLNSESGEIENPAFIDMTSLDAGTPKGILQVGDEIWITDQLDDVIYRFDMTGTYLSEISGNMDNIKGLDIVNNSEVWVTNAGTNNSAPGDAIVKFDFDGNELGSFSTDGITSFDVLDAGNNEVYISYIDDGSPIEIRDYDGNFVDYLVDAGHLNFAQQMNLSSTGGLWVANFSTPDGIYMFDIETGLEIAFTEVTNPRGVIETGDGNILYTNSSGIYKLDVVSGISTLISEGSAQYFTKLNAETSGGCTTPSLSVETPEPICQGNMTTLVANSNGDYVNWYDAEDATTPIFTGTEFQTPELNESTTYWVQAFNQSAGDGEIIEGGARISPSSNSQSDVVETTSPWGLSFDAAEDFTITSVDVYLTGAAGDLHMQLLDSDWNVIDETTVACPAGNSSNPVQFQVPLNFSAQAGNTYRLVAAYPSVEMVREFSSEHPGFPYPIGDVGSVTGGTIDNSDTNNTVYYFFYNWTVQTGDIEICESERIQVDVTVNPTPDAPTGESDQFFMLGDTLEDLDVTATGNLTWYSDAEATIQIPENTPLIDGVTYYVTQSNGDCESEVLAITVHLTLGVNDFNNGQFSIYPNPLKDVLNITGKTDIQSVEIYDLTGRNIQTIQKPNNNQIDFSEFNSGTYLLKIVSNQAIQYLKVIKK